MSNNIDNFLNQLLGTEDAVADVTDGDGIPENYFAHMDDETKRQYVTDVLERIGGPENDLWADKLDPFSQQYRTCFSEEFIATHVMQFDENGNRVNERFGRIFRQNVKHGELKALFIATASLACILFNQIVSDYETNIPEDMEEDPFADLEGLTPEEVDEVLNKSYENLLREYTCGVVHPAVIAFNMLSEEDDTLWDLHPALGPMITASARSIISFLILPSFKTRFVRGTDIEDVIEMVSFFVKSVFYSHIVVRQYIDNDRDDTSSPDGDDYVPF